MLTRHADAPPYVTKDGSVIRELMHPAVHGNAAQSLAEATLPPGGRTTPHTHGRSEEIYHVSAGAGVVLLGDEALPVSPGDTVCIPPGTPHAMENTGSTDLVVLCCCSPPYAHADTTLMED